MPASYMIEKTHVRLNLVGVTPPEDVTRCFLEMLSDPDCPPVAAFLMDTSRSTSLATRRADQIRYAARFIGAHAGRIGGRFAILVSSNADLELALLGGVYSESVGVETRGFLSEAAALEWLGVGPADNSL